MSLKELPLSELLQNREIFAIFDDEFNKEAWLDASALLKYEGTMQDLYSDGSVPEKTLDKISEKLQSIEA